MSSMYDNGECPCSYGAPQDCMYHADEERRCMEELEAERRHAEEAATQPPENGGEDG